MMRLGVEAMAPRATASGLFAWNLDRIKCARDEQMRGVFAMAARLAEAMRTDDALFVAKTNRLAPAQELDVKLIPAKGARAKAIANEAEGLFGQDGVGLTLETLTDIHSCFVDHGVAFAVCVQTVRADGSRVDTTVKAWPIEWVRWYPYERVFKTRISATDAFEEVITHGDGRWVIFSKHEIEPWKWGAVLPAALIWARHAFAVRDWAKSSVAHGNAKIVGELPEGIPLQADGGLSAEASAFLELLRAMGESDRPFGIRPAGSKTDFIASPSNAWQVFSELALGAEKAAARVYLGTDGILGTQGGAPGVDITALLGVASTLIGSDLRCLEKGIKTGIIDPWCALNFGDSALAPMRKYIIPDELAAPPDAAPAAVAPSEGSTPSPAPVQESGKVGSKLRRIL